MSGIADLIESHSYVTPSGDLIIVPIGEVLPSGFYAEIYDAKEGSLWRSKEYVRLDDAISHNYQILTLEESSRIDPESPLAKKLRELQVKKLTQTINEHPLTPLIEEAGKQ